MQILPEATHQAPREMIDFYKRHFATVHAVTCSKCKNSLAIELSDPLSNDLLGLTTNSLGIVVLPVDDKLLSTRIRTDNMIGYQCICGNDTRSFDIEEQCSPLGEFQPHEIYAIEHRMAEENWQAPLEQKNGKEYRGTFVVEKV